MWRPRPSLLTLLLLSPWGLFSRPAYAQSSGGEPLPRICEKPVISLVKDIAPGCAGNLCASSAPNGMVEMGGVLYFQAIDGEPGSGQGNEGHGNELWSSNSKTGETKLVRDIATSPSHYNANPRELTVVHGTLFFVADQDGNPTLWKTQGDASNTVFVKSLTSDESTMELTALSDTLFFKMKGQGGGTKLWRSDGTGSGTVEVAATENYANPQFLTALGDWVYFQAQGSHGAELWKGNRDGAQMVKDLCNGCDGSPTELTVVNGRLFFLAIDALWGNYKLWWSSGSQDDTRPVEGITGNGSLENLTAAGSSLFFTLTDSNTVLWAAQGPQETTALRSFSQRLSPFTYVNGLLFFMHGSELWKSDGTKRGTQLVKDFALGHQGAVPTISLIAPGAGMAILVASTSEGYELWKSNGTLAGTLPIDKYPYPAGFPSPTTAIVSAGTKLFFAATQSRESGSSTLVGDELFAMDFKKVDCTLPKVECVESMTVEALGPGGAQVQYLPPRSTRDDSLLPVTVGYTPAPGTVFPWQKDAPPHTVKVTAYDGVGNENHCEMKVSVNDSTAPWIQCRPERLHAEATAMEGAPVFFQVSANDAVFLDRVEFSTPSGSFFPVGETEVKATAVDGANNRSECTFWVDVKDRMPPSIECPGPQTVAVQGWDGGRVEFAEASAQDNAGPPEVSYSPGQGSVFPAGETVVTATATDAEGNTASCTFPVTVTGGGSEDEGEGCGCRSGGLAGSVVWLLLVLFPAWTRRRAGRLGV